MSRDEFIKRLEYLLSDIPEEERQDAIDYYRDYLEDAGEEAEKAIREFGSPERIAAIIRSDLQGNLRDAGEFTDAGYRDERFKEPNLQMAVRRRGSGTGGREQDGCEQGTPGQGTREQGGIGQDILGQGSREQGSRGQDGREQGGSGGNAPGLLWGVLVVFVLLAVLAAALTLALFSGALVIAGYGFVLLLSDLPAGALCIGAGLMLLSLGLLSLLALVWLCVRFIPWLFRSCSDPAGRLSHGKREKA